VIIDRSLPGGEFDVVQIDNVDAGYRLTTHLIENGYRRIAILCGETSTTGVERRMGYEKALRERGLTVSAEQMKYIPPKIEAGYAATLKLLTSTQPPEALVTTNSLLAEGALQAIRERNLIIPDEIALVTFDDTTWASLVQPPLTLIAQPTYEIGQTAIDLLLQRVADPQRPTRQVILKGQLLIRGSSARRTYC
jgi:LacI family fructose operon transcriptional repressor